jgi:hypothetical protein
VGIPPGGAEGMLNTNGGRFGGYGLYLLKGKPVFTYVQFTAERFRWESPNALAPGKHTIVFNFKYDGPGFSKGAVFSWRTVARSIRLVVDRPTAPSVATRFRGIVADINRADTRSDQYVQTPLSSRAGRG